MRLALKAYSSCQSPHVSFTRETTLQYKAYKITITMSVNNIFRVNVRTHSSFVIFIDLTLPLSYPDSNILRIRRPFQPMVIKTIFPKLLLMQMCFYGYTTRNNTFPYCVPVKYLQVQNI